MNEYITDNNFLEFEDEELKNFFNKFSYNNLDFFDSILYFSGFSGDNIEFINKLKTIKEKVQNNKKKNYSKMDITQEIYLLNTKELELIVGLLDEASFCAQCDNRYLELAHYLDYLKTKCELKLEKNIHEKQKILYKKH